MNQMGIGGLALGFGLINHTLFLGTSETKVVSLLCF